MSRSIALVIFLGLVFPSGDRQVGGGSPGLAVEGLRVSIVGLLQAAALGSASQQAAKQGPKSGTERPVVKIDTSKGTISVELLPEEAPKTVENFLRYVEDGFYDDTIFHRVIAGFVIQGGAFTPELEAKPTRAAIKIESKNRLKNIRGTIAMARTQDKNSAASQFFINLADNQRLNRSGRSFGYTVFGRVIEGMEVADKISKVQTSRRGSYEDIPILPVYVLSVRRTK